MNSTRRTDRRAQRGFSLIEMAVATSILSVVLALSMTTIVGMFRVERQFARDAQHDLATSRLAAQFRADAHAAVAAEVDADCRLTQSDGRTVKYAFADARITREVLRDGAIEHRDSFPLDRRAVVRFALVPEFDNRLVAVRIVADGSLPRSGKAAVRPLLIESAVGIHAEQTLAEEKP